MALLYFYSATTCGAFDFSRKIYLKTTPILASAYINIQPKNIKRFMKPSKEEINVSPLREPGTATLKDKNRPEFNLA